MLVGVDPDLQALRDNASCDHRALGMATALPFADASFDLITSNMVFEHLARPDAALSEIRRVLKPGGHVIFHTPNQLDIVSIVAALVPNRWHQRLVAIFEKRDESDVYPTYYRFNRRRRIEKLLGYSRFKHWRLEPLEQPNGFGHLPVIAQIEAGWHLLARRFRALRGTFLIEAQRD